MVELEETKRSLVQIEEDMQQMMERLKMLEESQERKTRQSRWEPRKATRYQRHYGTQEEDDEE